MSLARIQKLAAQGKLDEAERALLAIPEKSDPRNSIALSWIQGARGELETALETLRKSSESRPDHAPTHLFRAIAAVDLATSLADSAVGDAPAKLLLEAEEMLKRVLQLQPENDVANSWLGLILMRLGRDREGAAIFRKRGFNDNRMFRARLSEWVEEEWLRGGRFWEDRSAPEMAPQESDATSVGFMERRRRSKIGARLYLKRQYSEVMAELNALTRGPELDAGAVLTCASAAELLCHWTTAMNYLDRLPADDPEKAPWPDHLLAVKGRVLVRLRRFAEAAELFNRVTIVGPEDLGTSWYYGVICLAGGQREKARALFLRAHTQYMIDTLESQWWQVEGAVLALSKASENTPATKG